MVNVTFTQKFDNYSEKAIQQVINGCEGKPFYSTKGDIIIGEITKGERVEGTKNVRFDVDVPTHY